MGASGEPVGESKGFACAAFSTAGDEVGESNGSLEMPESPAVTCCRATEASETVELALLIRGGGIGGFGDTARAGERGTVGVPGRELTENPFPAAALDASAVPAPNLAAIAATDIGPSCSSCGKPWL